MRSVIKWYKELVKARKPHNLQATSFNAACDRANVTFLPARSRESKQLVIRNRSSRARVVSFAPVVSSTCTRPHLVGTYRHLNSIGLCRREHRGRNVCRYEISPRAAETITANCRSQERTCCWLPRSIARTESPRFSDLSKCRARRNERLLWLARDWRQSGVSVISPRSPSESSFSGASSGSRRDRIKESALGAQRAREIDRYFDIRHVWDLSYVISLADAHLDDDEFRKVLIRRALPFRSDYVCLLTREREMKSIQERRVWWTDSGV